jgi:hypothetical protein
LCFCSPVVVVVARDSGVLDDLDSIAEQELLKCAQIIEDAMNSLAAFSIDKSEKKGPRDVLNLTDINAAIVDAATAMGRQW